METEANSAIGVVQYYMQGEINSFIKVWVYEFISLSYCYFFAGALPKGRSRLAGILPVVFLNLVLPFTLHTLHLGVLSAFFLSWLCNFKLLLFAAGDGPLSDSVQLSLRRFLAVASLPIQTQKNPEKIGPSVWNYGVKLLLIPLCLKAYDYEEIIPRTVLLAIYSVHVYVGLEIMLAVAGVVARTAAGVELEPQFDEPYLSASLQDFWGRRWNIMVTRILRPSVYIPVRDFSKRVVGRKWAALPAILAAFIVSAVMHELVFFYMGRRVPTGEISAFFLLHGACLVAEVAVKKAFAGRRGLPRFIAAPVTVGFVMVTGFWLFFPEFLRSRAMERAVEEYAVMGSFAGDFWRALFGSRIIKMR